MNTYDQFHTLLDQLIALNQQHRYAVNPGKARWGYPPIDFAKMFCTVVVDLGRQIGKTEYIKQRADENSLVIVNTVQQGHAFYGQRTPFQVMSVDQLARGGATGRQFTTIYVDEPAHLIRKVGWQKFYALLTDARIEQTFVILGDLSWC